MDSKIKMLEFQIRREKANRESKINLDLVDNILDFLKQAIKISKMHMPSEQIDALDKLEQEFTQWDTY